MTFYEESLYGIKANSMTFGLKHVQLLLLFVSNQIPNQTPQPPMSGVLNL